jgi:hypothetical protein
MLERMFDEVGQGVQVEEKAVYKYMSVFAAKHRKGLRVQCVSTGLALYESQTSTGLRNGRALRVQVDLCLVTFSATRVI